MKAMKRNMKRKAGTMLLTGALATGMLFSPVATMNAWAKPATNQSEADQQELSEEELQAIQQLKEQERMERTYSDIVRQGGYNREDEAQLTVVKIATQEDLENLAVNCRLDSWSSDKKVVLENDIALKGSTNLVIPVFSGIFDGNGYTISGWNLMENGSELALFRYLQAGGEIRNLSLRGAADVKGMGESVAGLVGVNCGHIQGCSFEGRISGVQNVGGIAGYNTSTGSISDCKSAGFFKGDHSIGGIAGKNDGVINACQNTGRINTETSEVNYNLDNLTVENLTDINSTSKIAAFTDVGGIVGVSKGKIYYCTNTGEVGYPRVGYNVGGIAGRLSQGYMAGCVNTGLIQGRKDVGGIVGQMEPFMIAEYMTDGIQMIQEQTAALQSLIDKTTGDINRYGNQLTSMMGNLGQNLQDLNGIDPEKLKQNENKQISDIVSEGLSGAQVQDWSQFNQEIGDGISNAGSHVSSNADKLKANMELTSDYAKQFGQLMEKGGNSVNGDVRAIQRQITSLQNLIQDMQNDLFSYEGLSFSDASDEGASDTSLDDLLASLGVSLSEGELKEVVGNNEGGAGTESGEEAENPVATTGADLVRSGFQLGKMQLCVNQGTVEADTAVGGIVGRIAVEYDSDPEDDVELTGDQSLKLEATAKAVIRDCKNLGEVDAKKDQVGGIVGVAEFGSVISCESYGDVISAGGDYVGGIAGVHRKTIRSCYSMCNVEGINYVGGIAGFGYQVLNSVAYNTFLNEDGERLGAIAGQINEEGLLYGNIYVQGDLAGVNGIDYAKGAEPVTYAELCKMDGIPSAFSNFTITFLADGVVQAEIETTYGASIAPEQIPEVPAKEGFYGVWPDYDFDFVCGNKVLEAHYEKWAGSVASSQVDDEGKPLLLAVGDFLPGAEMEMSTADGEYKFSVYYPETAETARAMGITTYDGPVQVRILSDNPDFTKVEAMQDGIYHGVETTTIGSYISFQMDQPGNFRVTEVVDYSKYIKIGACVALVLALLTIIIVVKRVRKIKKRINDKIEAEVAQRLNDMEEQKAKSEL